MLLRKLHDCGTRLLAALAKPDPEGLGELLIERSNLAQQVEQSGAFEHQSGFDEWGERIAAQHRAIDRALTSSLLHVERRMADLDRAESAQRRYVPHTGRSVLRDGLTA